MIHNSYLESKALANFTFETFLNQNETQRLIGLLVSIHSQQISPPWCPLDPKSLPSQTSPTSLTLSHVTEEGSVLMRSWANMPWWAVHLFGHRQLKSPKNHRKALARRLFRWWRSRICQTPETEHLQSDSGKNSNGTNNQDCLETIGNNHISSLSFTFDMRIFYNKTCGRIQSYSWWSAGRKVEPSALLCRETFAFPVDLNLILWGPWTSRFSFYPNPNNHLLGRVKLLRHQSSSMQSIATWKNATGWVSSVSSKSI